MLKVKLMWAETNNSLWNMISEKNTHLEIGSIFKKKIKDWQTKYERTFHQWLFEDKMGDSLFDISSQINSEGRNIVELLNSKHLENKFYYWFDKDRTNDDQFEWKSCTKCNVKLKNLGTDYPAINRLICENCHIVYPFGKSILNKEKETINNKI